MSLPSEIPFVSYFQYSPRGTSEASRNSRKIRDWAKNAPLGRDRETGASFKVLDRLADNIARNIHQYPWLWEHLGPDRGGDELGVENTVMVTVKEGAAGAGSRMQNQHRLYHPQEGHQQTQTMTTEEQILDAVVIGASTDLSAVACWLNLNGVEWCVIGGAAVDAYAPPTLYTARFDVAADREPGFSLLADLAEEGFRVQVDDRAQVASAIRPGDGHRLRVAIHYGPRFRSMPVRAARRLILGRALPVASLPDVVAALLTARAQGAQTRAQVESEMHLFRLAEQHAAQVDALLPPDLRARAEADRERVLVRPDGDGWG